MTVLEPSNVSSLVGISRISDVLVLFLYMHCNDLFLWYHWNHLSSQVILSCLWLLLLTPKNSDRLCFLSFKYVFVVVVVDCIFFLFTIKSLQLPSLCLKILSYFLRMCLAFESPVFNANTFVSDSKPQHKSTVLPTRWTQSFSVS